MTFSFVICGRIQRQSTAAPAKAMRLSEAGGADGSGSARCLADHTESAPVELGAGLDRRKQV
jgi:hypothetical protein